MVLYFLTVYCLSTYLDLFLSLQAPLSHFVCNVYLAQHPKDSSALVRCHQLRTRGRRRKVRRGG